MSEHIIRFSDEAYTITVSHEKHGDLHHVTFHKKLEGSIVDSKFQMFLEDAQFRNMANFLWFQTGREK
jgi:hypothetical protein